MSARPDDPAQERARTVARLVETAGAGASELAHELLPVLYEELRALARARLAREAPGRTLQATALVHEAYLRLVGNQDPGWNGRAHFFGAAAQAMRRILVEEARRKQRAKRGGGRERVDLADVEIPVEPPVSDVLAVDEAVKKLEESDPRKAAIVSLRYFAGLTAEETARALDVSLGTVEREWRFIKVWLQEELEG